jgi:hypothetical protein
MNRLKALYRSWDPSGKLVMESIVETKAAMIVQLVQGLPRLPGDAPSDCREAGCVRHNNTSLTPLPYCSDRKGGYRPFPADGRRISPLRQRTNFSWLRIPSRWPTSSTKKPSFR